MSQRKVPPPPIRFGIHRAAGAAAQQRQSQTLTPRPSRSGGPVLPPRAAASGAAKGANGAVAQPLLESVGALAGGVSLPWVAGIAAGAYTANVLVERQTGRNIIGHLTYWTSDAIIGEVMDRALQAGIRPSSTQTFNGYTFSIDRYCRVYKVAGAVSRRQHPRVYDAVAPLVKAPNDQNGHIIADSLNGTPNACNFVGMTPFHNNAVGAGPDDETYSRMEAAVRHILDFETMYVRGRGSLAFARADIEINLTYPPWNATSRNTKLNYFRPVHFDVTLRAYTATRECTTYRNPYVANVVAGHMGVLSVRVSADFDNSVGPPARYLIGDPGYP